MPELQVAKRRQTGVGLRGNGSLLDAIDIQSKDVSVYDNGDVVPLFCSKDTRNIQAVGTVTLPPHRKSSVAIVMEKELTPTGTDLMGIVGILVVAHPELDGSLS